MMFHARCTEFVNVPHRTGRVLNTDEAIIAAYATHPKRPSNAAALREARRGGIHYGWAIWENDDYTGIVIISEHWCKVEADQMNRRRAEENAETSMPELTSYE